MRKSSISVQRGQGAGSAVAIELGRRIRAARESRGLTQSQVGCPLTKSYVSAIERGTTLPSFGALLLLAEHLGLEPADLVVGVNRCATVPYSFHHGDATDTHGQAT